MYQEKRESENKRNKKKNKNRCLLDCKSSYFFLFIIFIVVASEIICIFECACS